MALFNLKMLDDNFPARIVAAFSLVFPFSSPALSYHEGVDVALDGIDVAAARSKFIGDFRGRDDNIIDDHRICSEGSDVIGHCNFSKPKGQSLRLLKFPCIRLKTVSAPGSIFTLCSTLK